MKSTVWNDVKYNWNYIYIHVDICVYYMNSHNVIIETYINQY